jgi:hypothetical protein
VEAPSYIVSDLLFDQVGSKSSCRQENRMQAGAQSSLAAKRRRYLHIIALVWVLGLRLSVCNLICASFALTLV